MPIGYAALAFALGVAGGTVVRRTVPAIAITLAVYVPVLVAVPTVRAHLAPATLTTRITQANFRGLSASFDVTGTPNGPVKDLKVAVDKPGAWIVANETLDPSRAVVDELSSWMSGLERLTAAGYRQRVSYQPAGRFWTLHGIETAFFPGLAGLLTAFTFWWVRKRLA